MIRNPSKTVDRRKFLVGGAKLLAGSSLAGAASAGASQAATAPISHDDPSGRRRHSDIVTGNEPYGLPSRHENHVARQSFKRISGTAEGSVSLTPLHDLSGALTPNGVFFEHCHGGCPDIDPASHALVIHGLVGRPAVLSLTEIERMPCVDRICFTECSANGGLPPDRDQIGGVRFMRGMLGCAQWTGVTLRVLFDHVGLRPNAKWLIAESADAAATRYALPIEKALDDVMIAYAQNGERLRPRQGYPLRLVVPGWEGRAWVKWLRRLEVDDHFRSFAPGDSAGVHPPVQEVNSVITSPSPEKPLDGAGAHTIRGLAWSGRGRIERVEVSTDGGVNWIMVPLQEPVLPKALTRFYLPWRWDGDPVLLLSRAIDETGYVQPTMGQWRAARGFDSADLNKAAIYHNNSIVAWSIDRAGGIEYIQSDWRTFA